MPRASQHRRHLIQLALRHGGVELVELGPSVDLYEWETTASIPFGG